MAPCIEVVGYRQRKKGITSFGDLCSDFGANVKFLVGSTKKYKRINIGNLKTNISNKKIDQSISVKSRLWTRLIYSYFTSWNFLVRRLSN